MEILQYCVYRNQIKDVEELHQHIKEEPDSVDQRVTDTAIREWCKRLQACTAADGEKCTVKMTALLLALMQHACMIIN